MTREEAINEIKSWDFLEGKEIEAIHTLIPELRESEDERIRKFLVDYFTSYKIGNVATKLNGVRIDDILAYLEKQKYDRMKPIYDARESFESALEKAWNDYHNGYENVDKLEDDYVECAYAKGFREGYLFGVEKQKEQKPSCWNSPVMTHEMIMDEQKPELVQHPPITYTYNSNASRDERLKAALLALLNSDLLKVKEGGYFTKQDLIEWVERIPTDKPAEWSEEDEEISKRIIADLRWGRRNTVSDKDIRQYDEEINWMENRLKSLRPHWKPGEEQMEALNYAIAEWDGGKRLEGLYALRDDLKKLM